MPVVEASCTSGMCCFGGIEYQWLSIIHGLTRCFPHTTQLFRTIGCLLCLPTQFGVEGLQIEL